MPTRSPAQVASHAQKHFQRQAALTRPPPPSRGAVAARVAAAADTAPPPAKRRRSVFDVTQALEEGASGSASAPAVAVTAPLPPPAWAPGPDAAAAAGGVATAAAALTAAGAPPDAVLRALMAAGVSLPVSLSALGVPAALVPAAVAAAAAAAATVVVAAAATSPPKTGPAPPTTAPCLPSNGSGASSAAVLEDGGEVSGLGVRVRRTPPPVGALALAAAALTTADGKPLTPTARKGAFSPFVPYRKDVAGTKSVGTWTTAPASMG